MTSKEETSHAGLSRKSAELLRLMRKRRSARSFTSRPIPIEVIEDCISIAASAPSGANMQPWSFVLVTDQKLKTEIRKQAEGVEKEFYARRISKEWKSRLKPLGTSCTKEFLEKAPYLICIFVQKYGVDSNGNEIKHYYPVESVGIATGFLISALHQLGISSLPYTPMPMTFLTRLLKRPPNEKPFMIVVVGYPSKSYEPPKIKKKVLGEYLTRL